MTYLSETGSKNAGLIDDFSRDGEPDMLKISEVARRLSCSRSLVFRLVHSGELPSCRITEKAIRVPRAALMAWLASKQE